MKKVMIVLLAIISYNTLAQKKEKFNLGFENKQPEQTLSDGWFKWGSYELTTDTVAHSGRRSGKITSGKSGNAFGSIAFKIPANYKGATIKLEGYMKIQNVEDGFAGLLLRVDGNGTTLAFDNMEDMAITDTRDWQLYSITLDYPEDAETIIVAGILSGKGEAWFDEFTVSIDGKNIQTLKESPKKKSKAQLDTEFDQGSKIALPELTGETLVNLELLGRIWGFLKYHHPEIAKGNYNWDYELFRFLRKYLVSKNTTERDNLIINWIDSLGPVKECNLCKPVDKSAFIKPDFEWIDSLSEQLKSKLMLVYNRRSQGKHYYIAMTPGVGNPEFRNENSYKNMTYADAGFRLLSLFRYWNMIHYFFPYKHLIDKGWNSTLREYLPIFLAAKNELDYELAVLQLIGEVHDTHANLWGGADKIDEWKGVNYPPVHLRFIENHLVVTDYYNEELRKEVGLNVGDVITRINGKPVEEIVRERAKYYPASNTSARLRDISGDILRSNTDLIEIEVKTVDGKSTTKSLKLYPEDSLRIYRWYPELKERSYKLLNDNIGYVTLQTIKEEDIPRIKTEFKDTKGIIIDIRNYPATFVPFSLGSYFVSSSKPFAKFTTGSINNPGAFTFTEAISIPGNGNTYKGKLVVLTNELSQSQAEYTAMAFRAGDHTTIIGSTTAGADGNVSNITPTWRPVNHDLRNRCVLS